VDGQHGKAKPIDQVGNYKLGRCFRLVYQAATHCESPQRQLPLWAHALAVAGGMCSAMCLGWQVFHIVTLMRRYRHGGMGGCKCSSSRLKAVGANVRAGAKPAAALAATAPGAG
jgi:hypothetical protein